MAYSHKCLPPALSNTVYWRSTVQYVVFHHNLFLVTSPNTSSAPEWPTSQFGLLYLLAQCLFVSLDANRCTPLTEFLTFWSQVGKMTNHTAAPQNSLVQEKYCDLLNYRNPLCSSRTTLSSLSQNHTESIMHLCCYKPQFYVRVLRLK